MFNPTAGRAHFLCLASSTTALLSTRLDDIKWLVSTLVSLFGTVAAICMFSIARRDRAAKEAPARPTVVIPKVDYDEPRH
jgi:hypothetical protein